MAKLSRDHLFAPIVVQKSSQMVGYIYVTDHIFLELIYNNFMDQQFFAGGVLVNSQNKIYLLKNIKRDEWVLPKGKLDESENSLDAAIRELKEETGFNNFKLKSENPIYMSHYQFTNEINHIIYDKYVTYYLFELFSEEKQKTKEMEEEGLEGKWFDINSAISIATYEDTKEVLKITENIISNNLTTAFLLGGNSLKNMDWIKKASIEFKDKFQNQRILFYNHWSNPNTEMDIFTEAKKLANLGNSNSEYVVFAKSAGIITTLISIHDFGLKPKKCVFVGLPINILNEINLELLAYIKELNIPTVLFQNSEDPFASYSDVKELLIKSDNKNIELYEEEGNTHDYNNFNKYLSYL